MALFTLALVLTHVTALAAPLTPSKLRAVVDSSGQVLVSWRDRSSNEKGFVLSRSKLIKRGVYGRAKNIKIPSNHSAITDSPGLGTFRYRLRAVSLRAKSPYTKFVRVVVNHALTVPSVTPTPIATAVPTVSITPTPSGAHSNILVPGSGFDGNTSQPPIAGVSTQRGYDARAIGRWDVVPFQEIRTHLRIGVVAFHISGIESVSFSLEGGPPVVVQETSYNPDSQVHEYVATFDARAVPSDREVEIRAVIKPKVGISRILQDSDGADLGSKSLRLLANGGGQLVNTGMKRWVDNRQSVPIASVSGMFDVKKVFRGLTSGALGFVEQGTHANTLVFSPYRLRNRYAASGFLSGETVSTSSFTAALGGIEEWVVANNVGSWRAGGKILKGHIMVGETSGAEGYLLEGSTTSSMKFMPTKGMFVAGERIHDAPYGARVRATVMANPVFSNDGVNAQLSGAPIPNAGANSDGSENNPYASLEEFMVKHTGMLSGADKPLDGMTVYLKSGTHTYPEDFFTEYQAEGRAWWQSPPGSAFQRWFTLEGAPGIPREQIVLTSPVGYLGDEAANVGQQKLHLKNLTLRQTTNATVVGLWSGPFNNHFWIDQSDLIGLGYNDWYNRSVAAIVGSGPGPTFWTDISIQQAVACFGNILGRHIYAQNLGGDFINNQGLTINARLNNLDIPATPSIFPDGVHPDVIQVLAADNLIVYGLNAIDVTAQGLNVAGGNFAIVNALIKQKAGDVQASWIAGGSMNHILYWNVTLATHTFAFNSGGQKNLSIRNSVLRVSTFQPNVDTSGWQVENNHFIPIWNTTGTFGTNSTVGDPRFVDFQNDNMTPNSTSPLLYQNRLVAPMRTSPVDANGDLRGASSAIGALRSAQEQ